MLELAKAVKKLIDSVVLSLTGKEKRELLSSLFQLIGGHLRMRGMIQTKPDSRLQFQEMESCLTGINQKDWNLK